MRTSIVRPESLVSILLVLVMINDEFQINQLEQHTPLPNVQECIGKTEFWSYIIRRS